MMTREEKELFFREAKEALSRRYPEQRRRVLIIEDEPGASLAIESSLENLGCELVVSRDLQTALSYLRSPVERFDMALVNLTLPPRPDMPPIRWVGFDIIRWCRINRPNMPTIICTGFDWDAPEIANARTGENAINPFPPLLDKPFTLDSCKTLLAQFGLAGYGR